jgi:hypothetical protein
MKGAIVKDKDAVLCLAKSILYEKTHDGYVHLSPTESEEYLADFAADDTTAYRWSTYGNVQGMQRRITFVSGSRGRIRV